MRKTVLIVEDEIKIGSVVANYFKNSGYEVVEAADGKTALEKWEDNIIDLVILDIMLPVLDGWTVLRKIRQKSNVLIIMLTALGGEDDKLAGFELGVDEYVTKPFSPKVLVARANALLARSKREETLILDKDTILTVDKNSHTASIKGVKLELTQKEFAILLYLFENSNSTLSRNQILAYVWGYDFYGDSRVVDNHVRNLRNKLKDNSEIIKTVVGFGYSLEIADEK